MKIIILVFAFLLTFMGMFFILSLIGLLWYSYKEVIINDNWFMYYTAFIGLWLGITVVDEVNDKIKKW